MASRALICEVCPAKNLGEVWKEIALPTRHRYEVSTEGRVRNLTMGGRLLKPQLHATGYLTVNLGRSHRNRYVHRLVALTFFDPPPRDGMAWEVDHINWEKEHNTAYRLRWLHKDTNQWRWKFWTTVNPYMEEEIDPKERARVDEMYAAAVAAGMVMEPVFRPLPAMVRRDAALAVRDSC